MYEMETDIVALFQIIQNKKLSKDVNRPLPIGKKKKAIVMMNDKLGEKGKTEIVALKAKMYSYIKIES